MARPIGRDPACSHARRRLNRREPAGDLAVAFIAVREGLAYVTLRIANRREPDRHADRLEARQKPEPPPAPPPSSSPSGPQFTDSPASGTFESPSSPRPGAPSRGKPLAPRCESPTPSSPPLPPPPPRRQRIRRRIDPGNGSHAPRSLSQRRTRARFPRRLDVLRPVAPAWNLRLKPLPPPPPPPPAPPPPPPNPLPASPPPPPAVPPERQAFGDPYHGPDERTIASAFMRDLNVDGPIPRSAAAPFSPPIRQRPSVPVRRSCSPVRFRASPLIEDFAGLRRQ